MTCFIHDQFAKDYLEELLKPFGTVEAPSRVAGEVREIDVFFSPLNTQNPDIELLGLLGKIAKTPAILEPFRNPASETEICNCLLKLLEVQAAFQRKAKSSQIKTTELETPKLWILTPTASTTILSGFAATEKPDWLTGVYFFPNSLRAAIVVIHQLPRTPETLWLRLLGRETVRNQAFEELKQLPANHPFLPATLELLYNLQLSLGKQQNLESEDRELIMRLAPLYQQDREQAKQEGRQEGQQEGEQRLVLRQIDRLFGKIDSALVEKVRSLPVEELENLGVALLDFADVADLENWFVQLEAAPQAEFQD
jgi:hypothetical protein